MLKVKPIKEAPEPEKEKTTNGETEKNDKETEAETEQIDKDTAEQVEETEETATNEEEKKKDEETENEEEIKSADAVVEKPETLQEPETADKPETVDEPSFDIDKVLAETSVPEVSADFESAVKKSVKFSHNLSKEFALKTMRVMQPESNLTDPQDVEDEFAFTEEPK